jgi:nitrite reductase/ring-hydroxylating ferredoxin subunit
MRHRSVDVGALGEFSPATIRPIAIDGEVIGIARWRDQVYAISNRCPDRSGPLAEGSVRPRLSIDGLTGDVELDQDHPVLSCPWHFWELDLGTGHAIRSAHRARTFRVSVVNDRVIVAMPIKQASTGEPE